MEDNEKLRRTLEEIDNISGERYMEAVERVFESFGTEHQKQLEVIHEELMKNIGVPKELLDDNREETV